MGSCSWSWGARHAVMEGLWALSRFLFTYTNQTLRLGRRSQRSKCSRSGAVCEWLHRDCRRRFWVILDSTCRIRTNRHKPTPQRGRLKRAALGTDSRLLRVPNHFKRSSNYLLWSDLAVAHWSIGLLSLGLPRPICSLSSSLFRTRFPHVLSASFSAEPLCSPFFPAFRARVCRSPGATRSSWLHRRPRPYGRKKTLIYRKRSNISPPLPTQDAAPSGRSCPSHFVHKSSPRSSGGLPSPGSLGLRVRSNSAIKFSVAITFDSGGSKQRSKIVTRYCVI